MGTPPDALLRLVDRFSQDRKVFLSGDYKEEQLRAEFPNGPSLSTRHSDFVIRTFHGPFFTALGWDRAMSLNGVRLGIEEALLFPAIIGDAGL